MPFGLVSAPLIFQAIVKAFVALLHALGLKLHFYLDDWLLRNASKDILKTQMKFFLHPCGTNVPSSGQVRQDIVQSQTAVGSKVLSGKGILKSHWPTKLSGRSSPTREVVSSTSSTSPAIQMETTPGPSGSGNSPSRILVKRSFETLGVRDSSQSGGVVTSTPSQTLHVHRRVQFRLGSPCERGRFIHILADALSRSNKLVSTQSEHYTMDIVQAVRDLWVFHSTCHIMGRHECLRIPSDPSHSGSAEQGDDGQGSPMSDAPCWPSQAWFPTLLELLTDHPRRLPEWDHLLWHPLGRVYQNSPSFYQNFPSFYKLHAWKLSGASSEQRNFLRTLSAASPLLRGGEPLTHISQSGLSTRLGVGKKGYILSFPLFPS
jgi:hypothetical protein